MRRTLGRIAAITIMSASVLIPSTAHADEAQVPDPCAVYTDQVASWKAAYERVEENYWEVMEENVILWNNIDYQNRKLDNKQATIDRLRAKLRKHGIGNDQITLQNTPG